MATATGLAAILGMSGKCGNDHLAGRSNALLGAIRRVPLDVVHGAGRISQSEGNLVLDDKDITKSTVKVTIDANTLETREPDSRQASEEPGFSRCGQIPYLTFKSTKVEKAGGGKLKVTGDLTIHGVTKSVVLDVDGPKTPIKDPWECSARPFLPQPRSTARISA